MSVEAYIRINHLTIDVPKREIGKDGIQKYKPGQTGYWRDATHSWQINSEGWAGTLPKSFSNLITLIGDSHIENFMNPQNCHLDSMLQSENSGYNFFEAGRSGVTLIEAVEIAKSLDAAYKPVQQFIFVKESDFKESITGLGRMEDVTQINLQEQQIVTGKLKSPFLKSILYNFKTLYYFREEFTKNLNPATSTDKPVQVNLTGSKSEINPDYDKLLAYIKEHYKTTNLVFFLHPETPDQYTALFESHGLKVYKFQTKEPSKWRNTPEDEAHWSCYGFQNACRQIMEYIKHSEKSN